MNSLSTQIDTGLNGLKEDIEWKTLFTLTLLQGEVVHGQRAGMNVKHGCVLLRVNLELGNSK